MAPLWMEICTHEGVVKWHPLRPCPDAHGIPLISISAKKQPLTIPLEECCLLQPYSHHIKSCHAFECGVHLPLQERDVLLQLLGFRFCFVPLEFKNGDVFLDQTVHRGTVDVVQRLELLSFCPIDIEVGMMDVHLWQKSIQLPHRSGFQLLVVAPLFDRFFVRIGFLLWTSKKSWIRDGSSHNVPRNMHHTLLQL